MTTDDREALAAARLLIDEFGVPMAAYLQRALDSGKESIDATDLRAAIGYAFSMREAPGADDSGVDGPTDAPVELDEEMIAESRRQAALGMVRPMREFLDERRTNAQH